MATVLKYWREAATLILVSAKRGRKNLKFNPVSSSSQSAVKGDNFDILMLKRSSKSSFMPNMYVFPGGVASDADFSNEWYDIFSAAGEEKRSSLFKLLKGNSAGAPMFSRVRDSQFSSIPAEVAFRICAIRETFEESGVLMARSVKDLHKTVLLNDGAVLGSAFEQIDNVNEWRKRVEQNAEEFITMCKDLKIVPDVWSLYEWSNWLTPTQEIIAHKTPRRYDTAFYLCCVEDKPHVAEDKNETVHSQWGSPLDILQEFEQGWAGIAPPQMYELSRFLHFTDMDDLIQFAWSRSRERVIRYLPVRYHCADSIFIVMPGDDLYPEQPDLIGRNEALTSNLTLEELNKEYPRMHRTMFVMQDGKRLGRVFCNIDMPGKHIPPYADFPTLVAELPDSKL